MFFWEDVAAGLADNIHSETLVREGLNLQSKTKAMAEERIGDVSGKVNEVKSQISSRATESWDKLEQVFEDRVSRALERLGVPTRKDVQALIRHMIEAAKSDVTVD